MPEYTEKLNYFTRVVLDEAAHENQKLLDTLDAKLADALREAEDKLLDETYRTLSREAAEVRAEAGRRVSQHMMQGKRALALRRETIAHSVFDDVSARLKDYTATPAYPERLRQLFLQSAESLGVTEGLTLFLRKCDLPHAAAVTEGWGGVTVAAGDFTMGGLILDHPAKRVRIDATFDASFHALDGHFAELFGLSLSDEV